jgi:AcrR family transcriptional regulator
MGGRVIPFDAPKNSATKARILDAAEELFMEHGFEATSLRQITATARVNLAAVNYHFGSKEDLFEAVLTRRLDPMNQERLALLTLFEHASAPKPLSCEKILAAMFIPALKLARDRDLGGKNFLRLLGRAYADPAPFIRHFLSAQYAVMIARFKAAFGRALPHLPRKELAWRLHFVMGALSFTLAGTDALKLIAALRGEAGSDEMLLRRLAPFLIAGLKAPLPDLSASSSPGRSSYADCHVDSGRHRRLSGPGLRRRRRLALGRGTRSGAGDRLGCAAAAVALGRRARGAPGRARHPAQLPSLATQADQRRRARTVPQDPAADDRDRTRGDRGRYGRLGR